MRFWLVIVALVVGAAPGALACSLVSCIIGGIELRHSFVVEVMHEGKPLHGATVEVTGGDQTQPTKLSLNTGSDGRTYVKGLGAGEYWLAVSHLGIQATGAYCFHVKRHPSLTARRTAKYKWGEFPDSTKALSGTITESLPGTGGTLLWNLSHPRTQLITGATFRLRNIDSSVDISTESDQEGKFAFAAMKPGLYVLHVEGGRGVEPYTPNDLLLSLNGAGRQNDLRLERMEGGCGPFMSLRSRQ